MSEILGKFKGQLDDSILTVYEVKDWVSKLFSTYKNVSDFLIEEPIGDIFTKLQQILSHVENYPMQIAFCGRPRVGKSYILNYLMTEQLGLKNNKSRMIGHYPCPTSPGLQPTTRIPVKFIQSSNHSIKLSVMVCQMKEYIKRVQYELKEGYSFDEFGLNKDYTKRFSVNKEIEQIFEWMDDNGQGESIYDVFENENIEEGLIKCHEFITKITNYNQPYLRVWEAAVDMIIISLPNEKLHLKSFMDIPGLTEINFRSKKITKACEKIDIVVFVCDNHSACTLQDLEVLDTYGIIKDTTDHPPFPIILVNETRSNSIKPRGPYTIIDEVKGCDDTQKRDLTFLESIKYRFLSDCRSDASVNSKFLFHDFQTDIRESLFTDLRENVCCLIFYPLYEDYNSVDEFWKFIKKGDLLKRNEMLREDGIRYIRLIISCLTTILKQLKKKKRIFLPSSINKRKNDKIDSMIHDIHENIESMTLDFKNHIDIHLEDDIIISFKNLLKSIIHDVTFQMNDLNIDQFITDSVELLEGEYEDMIIQSFYKEGTERKPYLLTEMDRIYSYLVDQIASLESFKLNFESLKQLLKENGEHFIHVSSKMIPPPLKDIKYTINDILNDELHKLTHFYYDELKEKLNGNYELLINELTNRFLDYCSESIKKRICYHYIDLFMNETLKFIKMIQSLMNQSYKSDFISIEKTKMLHNQVQSVHKRLTLYKAAMPFGYQPETIHGKYTCISSRRIMKPMEYKSNTLNIVDQNFKKNGNHQPNRNDTEPFKIHIIDDDQDININNIYSLDNFNDIFIISINTLELSTFIHSKVIQTLKNSLHESSYLNNSIISIICDYNNHMDVIEYIDMHDRIDYKCMLIFYYYFDDDMIKNIHSMKPPNTTILHILFNPIPSQYRCPNIHLFIHGYSLSFIKSLSKLINVDFCIFLQPNLIATREYYKKTNMLEISSIHRSILTMIKTFDHLKERQSNEIMSFLNQKINRDEALKLGFTINEDEGYYYDEEDTILKNIYHQYSSIYNRNRLFYKICHDEQHRISKDPSILLKFIQCKQLKQQLENQLVLKSIHRVALISISGNRSSKMKRFHWKGCTFKESSTHSPFCLVNLKSIEGYNFISRKSLEKGYHNNDINNSNGRPMSLLNIWKRLTQILRDDGFLCYSLFNIQTITDDIEPYHSGSNKKKRKPYYSDILKSIHLLHSSSYRKMKKGLPLLQNIERLTSFNENNALMINDTQRLQMNLLKMNQMIDMTWFRKNDNDYFYESLSIAVIGEKYASNELLTLITDELIHHQSIYIELFISKLNDKDKLSMNNNNNQMNHHKSILFNKYVNDLRSKKIPGDEICLQAFSRSLKRDIIIYMSNGNGHYGYYRINYDNDSTNHYDDDEGRITLIYMKSKKSQQCKFVPIIENNHQQNNIINDDINSSSINNKRKRKRPSSNINETFINNNHNIIQSSVNYPHNNINILKDKDLNNIISDSNKRIKFNELSSFLDNRMSSRSILGLNNKTNIVNYSYSQHLRIIEIASIYGAFTTDRLSKDHLMNLAIYTNIGESENINNWIGELDPDDIYNALIDLRKMAFEFVKGCNKRDNNNDIIIMKNIDDDDDNKLIKCQCPNDHKDIFSMSNDDKHLYLKHFTLKTTGRSITYQKLKQIYLSTIFFDHWNFDQYDPYIDAFLEDDSLYTKFYEYIKECIPSYIPNNIDFPYHIFIILARILNKVGFNTIDKWKYILDHELDKKINDILDNNHNIDKSYIKEITLEFIEKTSDFKRIMIKTQSFFENYIGSMENV